MVTEEQVQTAGAMLWDHWQAGTVLAVLPDGCRPQSREDGYAIQALLERRSGAPLFGWKIAATSAAGQAHIGVDGPLAGRLIAERVVAETEPMSLTGNRMLVAEPEFAFRMARDLAPRAAPYAVDEVLDAVGSLHPAIEVPDSRYEDFVTAGAAQLIADNACAHLFVLGAATEADWRAIDLVTHEVRATVSGQPAGVGSGANVLDDPRLALTWLANELSDLGITLAKGQVVTTGTCMQPLAITPGDAVSADFGVLGSVGARFAPA